MEDNSIFFQCVVLDNKDPLMLGRIRGRRVIDNYEDIIKSVTDPPWNPEKDPWTQRDPFVFNSLLPYFLYQTPKIEELVQVIYLNKDFRYQNQYYVQNALSSPTASFKEFNFGGNKFTGTGMQIENPKWLKNADGTYPDSATHKGVFPEPGDNAILGRGSSDVIVKEDDVLLRAGKFKGNTLLPNIDPVGNPQRSFLQLSRFQKIRNPLPPKQLTELQENIVLVKYLIEWVITNPENEFDKFTGEVYLYQLKPDPTVNSKNLTTNSLVKDNLKKLVASERFSMLSLTDAINFINNFIKTCNDSDVTISGTRLFPSNNAAQKFPIFYRPSSLMSSIMNPSSEIRQNTSAKSIQNVTQVYNSIKLLPSIPGGYGLIYAKNKVGKPLIPKKITVNDSKYTTNSNTVAALGGDRVYLLSHNSSIPGKGKINFDGTLYGIDFEKFYEIFQKTSSTVRGEELLELLNLIVRFLVTHTHAYPGLPPVGVTQDGTKVSDILSQMQNAETKILNTNIRLN